MTAFGNQSSLTLCPPDLLGSGSSTKCLKESYYRAAAQRSCGFESVFRTNSFNHARLSWRALPI
eukprot:2484140-Pleurochrysis_carterae.AAC.1